MNNRVMIAGIKSGCGKTTVTCAILQALVNRGLCVASFKCGPDYIDPMFHSQIIGTHSRNLDPYFCDGDLLRRLFVKNASGKDIAIIEGVMGYYDGVGEAASSYHVSAKLAVPTVLVIDCKGMSQSVGAMLKGYLTYKEPSGITGVIFNRLPASLEGMAQDICRKFGVVYLGRFPQSSVQIESRHLGLVTAAEIEDLKEKMQTLAQLAEEHLLLDQLLEISMCSSNLTVEEDDALRQRDMQKQDITDDKEQVRIAVAYDRAFCFYYEDSLDLLRELGAQLVYFSPLEDDELPENVRGLLLGGGYPELYLQRLSEHTKLLASIRQCISDGMPVIAECGGFLYLHKCMYDDMDSLKLKNSKYPMAQLFEAEGFRTGKLQRFGYVELKAKSDNLLCDTGEALKAHEFHYWDSTDCGTDFVAKKASNGLEYECVHATKTMYAGFPHLYLSASPKAAARFVEACRQYDKK